MEQAYNSLIVKRPNGRIGLEIASLSKLAPAQFYEANEKLRGLKWKSSETTLISSGNGIFIPFQKGKDYGKYFSSTMVLFDQNGRKRISYQVNETKWCFIVDEQEENIVAILSPYNSGDSKLIGQIAIIFFQLIYGGEKFYTPAIKEEILFEVNRLLDPKASPSSIRKEGLDLTKVTSLTTLNFNDLRYGGIVGDQKYFVTPKADGSRVFVYISPKYGLFLIGTTSFMWITDEKQSPFRQDLLPALFEGELIPQSSRRNNAKYFTEPYLVETYDLLGLSGTSFVGETLTERNKYRKDFIEAIDRNLSFPVRLVYKTHQLFVTPHGFFEEMHKIFVSPIELNYETDGLVFTPAGPYLVSEKKIPQKLFKWKKPEDNTIDLLYKDGVWFQEDEKGKLAPISFITVEGKATNGLIYELKPILTERNKWKIYRERRNRRRPNNSKQLQTIFKSLEKPITQDTMLGNDLELYKHYQRREKGILLDFPSNYGENRILLDIGSGRLGDLSRWKKYSKIYALEPSAIYQEEGRERLNNYPDMNVQQINGKGEEPIVLENSEKVDVISMMFSLTFFGESEAKMKGLLNNIDNLLLPGGFLLLALLEGDLVQDAFNDWPTLINESSKSLVFPAGPTVQIVHPVGAVTDFSIEVTSNFGGTTVEEQKEYPVKMTWLLPQLEKMGIVPIRNWIFDREIFLNQGELYLTRLFSGWIFRRQGVYAHRLVEVKASQGRTTLKERPGSKPKAPEVTRTSKTPGQLPKPIEKKEPAMPKITEIKKPTCHMLKSGEKEIIGKFKGYDVRRYGVPGDGSCLIHAIFLSIDEDYQNADEKEREKIVRRYRRQLAKELTEEEYQQLAISTVTEGKLYTREKMVDLLKDPHRYLGFEELEYLSNKLEVNLIFFNCPVDGELSIYPTSGIVNDEHYWLPILYVGADHFESLAFKIDKVWHRAIEPDSVLVEFFRR